jgi:hypothetical protein
VIPAKIVFIAGVLMRPDRRFSSNDDWWQVQGDLGFHMSQSAASGDAVVVVATLVCEVGKSVLFASQRDELRLHVMT